MITHVLWALWTASKTSPEYFISIGLLNNAFFFLKPADWKTFNKSSKNNKCWAETFMQLHYATEINSFSFTGVRKNYKWDKAKITIDLGGWQWTLNETWITMQIKDNGFRHMKLKSSQTKASSCLRKTVSKLKKFHR